MGRPGLSKVLGRLALLACDLLPGTRTDIRTFDRVGRDLIQQTKSGSAGVVGCIAPRSTAGGPACERLRCIAGCRGWFLTLIQFGDGRLHLKVKFAGMSKQIWADFAKGLIKISSIRRASNGKMVLWKV